MHSVWCASLLGLLAGVATSARAADPQGDKDLELKLVAKNNKVAWDADGMSPAEYKKLLDKLAEAAKVKKGGPIGKIPSAPKIDLALVITNNSKQDMTIYLGGDPNVYTFELKGPEVVALPNIVPMTLEFRTPKEVTLKAGSSYEILVTKLSDGMRGVTRHVYWAAPGEYTLSVSYQLSDRDGQKTRLLKSEPIKITVESPK